MQLLHESTSFSFGSRREISKWVCYCISYYGNIRLFIVWLDRFYSDGGVILYRNSALTLGQFLLDHVF